MMSKIMPQGSMEDLEEGFVHSPSSKVIGEVKHFYSKRSVAAVELSNDVDIGDFVAIRNHNHVLGVSSLQEHHRSINRGRAGSVIGLKVPKGFKPRTDDKVYLERPQLIGHVTNYFSNRQVAGVRLGQPLTVGDVIIFRKGADFYKHVVSQMQINHRNVQYAEPTSLAPTVDVGIKVPGRIKRNTKVYVLERGVNVTTTKNGGQQADSNPLLVGKVTNAYKKINVLAVNLRSGMLALGDIICFRKGNRTFKHMITSMEVNRQRVDVAYPGEHAVGIKVPCCNSKHPSDPLGRNAAVYVIYGAANSASYSQW